MQLFTPANKHGLTTDKALIFLQERPGTKSFIAFEYTDKQIEKDLRPTHKRKITKQSRTVVSNPAFIVTLGRLSYSETEFIKRFHKEYGVWPADQVVTYPKKKPTK